MTYCVCVCLTSILEDLLKAPLGWTWSYRMMTPTMTLMQNKSVSSLLKRLEYSLEKQKSEKHTGSEKKERLHGEESEPRANDLFLIIYTGNSLFIGMHFDEYKHTVH